MFALSAMVVSADHTYTLHDGAFFEVPFELRSSARLNQLLRNAKVGWSKDDWGYFNYCSELPSGKLILVFGIILEGSKPVKKFPGYTASFKKESIESYVRGFDEVIGQERSNLQVEANNLIHDLRSISTTIYHATNEASMFVDQLNAAETSVRLKNIEAAQGLLKIRIDAYDYLANANPLRSRGDISIFRKVDKVTRLLKSNASQNSKGIRLTGNCYRKVVGPDLFELIPYPIIENAVKYSPEGGLTLVDVHDGVLVRIMVTSYGPRISRQEQELIFSRGARGEHAIASGIPGTGLGLHIARRIASEVFDGTIRVQQSPNAIHVDGQQFFETTFTIELPSVEI